MVAGYYSLCATSIELTDLPPTLQKKLPRYPLLPAILLGRLAVDTRYPGQRRGELLLLDAVRRALEQSHEIAAMAIVVDAKNEAAARFYERYDVQRFEDDRSRLFIPMATIAKLIASS